MLLLWILPLAASFLLPAKGEVVSSFNTCKQFFLDGNPPITSLSPMNPAIICQLYKNVYRFATMYDKVHRIPRFSAYRYQPGGSGRKNQWRIEPQLVLPTNKKSMELERTTKIKPQDLANSQAVSQDYQQTTIYDRGHLNPVAHQPDPDSKDATFTLTNIVPQFKQLNQGKWVEYEQNMGAKTIGCCDTYVLVGVVPGNTFISNGRVNVPSHIWSAACCVSQGNQRRSWAVIAENNQDQVVDRTLAELEKELQGLYNQGKIDLFNGAC